MDGWSEEGRRKWKRKEVGKGCNRSGRAEKGPAIVDCVRVIWYDIAL